MALFVAIITLQIALLIILQFPGVQTSVARKVTESVSSNLNGNISVGNVYYVFFNKLILNDISVVSKDQSPFLDSLKRNFNYSDTLLSCNKLFVTLDVRKLLNGEVKLNKVRVSGGEFNLQSEGEKKSNLNRIFNLKKTDQKDTTKGSLNLLAHTLKVSGFRFTMKNYEKYVPKGDSIINFSDLDVNDISIDISDISLSSDTLFANVNNITGTDKSGFRLARLSGKTKVSGKGVLLSDFYMADSYSVIKSKYFYMKYNSPKDFSEFITKVKLGLNLYNSYLNFQTIGKIAPTMRDSRLAFYLDGEISGAVNNIRAKDFVITSDRGHTFIEIDARVIGLPNASQTMVFADVQRSSVTFDDLSSIIASIHNTPSNEFIKNLAPSVKYEFSGNLVGLLDDFVAKGKILSSTGNVYLDLLFKNESNVGSRFSGTLVTDNLNAKTILSNDILGEVTLNSGFNALIKSNGGGIDLVIDSVNVQKFGFNGYDYKWISGNGRYTGKYFNGNISCHDPNLDFWFRGLFTFAKSIDNASKYDFKFSMSHSDLVALNLDKHNKVSRLKFDAFAKFTNLSNNYVNGKVEVKNAEYKSDNGRYSVGLVSLESLSANNMHSINFKAPFARAQYSGPAPVDIFIKKISDIVLGSKMDNYFQRDTLSDLKRGYYNFRVQAYSVKNLCKIINKKLYIEDNSKVNLTINNNDILKGEIQSGRIAIGPNYLKDFSLNLSSSYKSPSKATLFSESVKMVGLQLDSTIVDFVADDNLLKASFNFKNDSLADNSANINSCFIFKDDKKVDFNILKDSRINLHGEQWDIVPSIVSISDSCVNINRFCISNKDQNFVLDGNISKNVSDSLYFNLNNFNLGVLNLFMDKTYDIQGIFSGNGVISDIYEHPKAFFDVRGNSVSVYGSDVGSLRMMSKWNDNDKELGLYIGTTKDNKKTFHASGYYKPDSSSFNINASLEDLSVSYFEPFLSDLISKSSGSVSGELNLSGKLDSLRLTGENCRFNRLGFILNFTQVPYFVDGPFELNENGVFFKNLSLRDKYGSKGSLNGKLTYKYFKDIALDTRIDFTNLQCLNTQEYDNEFFYGNAFASGSLHIKGPLNDMALDIKAVSNKNTSIHIPLASSAEASQANLLTFMQPDTTKSVDSFDSLSVANAELPVKKSNMRVDIQAQVTPDAEIMIEIDKSVGNVIKAKGSGLIDLDIDPSRELFDIYGDYHVTDGSYKFVLAGITSRDFILQPGGTINFNGDVTNTNLNLNALYNIKTSINALIADTSSISTRRNVSCIIGMQGKMMNPQLSFKIDIPDLDPTTKIRVESALNTQGKIQKQFMAILVSGNFIPDEQSGIANNSSMLYSNASEMLSNQITNIFHQLGIPLDLGLNYQPGERGSDIFDVAVSTQLFNNRLTINGNIGNDPYAQNANGVIGNLDVEIKLDNSGNVRLDFFSHAEDQYSSYSENGTNSQRSGIGIVYQKEFNSFKNLLKGKSKAQKAYEKQERLKRREQKKRERESDN